MPATLKYVRPSSVLTCDSPLWLLACLISCCLTCTVGCDSQEKKFLDWLAPRKEPQKIKLGILHSTGLKSEGGGQSGCVFVKKKRNLYAGLGSNLG